MNEAQVQAIVDAAVAAAIAAAIPPAVAAAAAAIPPPAVGGGGGPAGPPPIVTFARTPAQHNVGLLNYGTSEGMKVYNAAIAALTTKYSGKVDMHIFLTKVKERGQLFGWKSIIEIPKDGSKKDLIDQYGLIDLEDIKAHALTYENEAGRDAQNASQMFTFLSASLTDEAQAMVRSDYSDYTIITTDGTQVNNGPCFLKVIIRNTTVDTRSTVFHIRENLNNLEAKMLEISYDIEAFNMYVTSQIEQLSARGETSSDLLINLFAAFLAVPDKKFVDYIEKQKDKYDEGEDISTKKLMQVALIKYKDRKRSDLWQAPSAEAEQILALTAQIGEMQKAKASSTTTADKAKKSSTHKDSKKKARTERFADKYAWKLVPPANGEPKTKEVNKKTYHFCPHHNDGAGLWVIHHPNKCDRREEKSSTSAKDKPMSLTKVLQAIQDEADDEASDEEE
jgi:hypothetical protein